MKDMSRNLTLLCETCGNGDFATEGEQHTCGDCSRVYSSDELTKVNQEIISNALKEVKRDVGKQLEKDFKHKLQKAFKSSTNIKVR